MHNILTQLAQQSGLKGYLVKSAAAAVLQPQQQGGGHRLGRVASPLVRPCHYSRYPDRRLQARLCSAPGALLEPLKAAAGSATLDKVIDPMPALHQGSTGALLAKFLK